MAVRVCPRCTVGQETPDEARAFRCNTCAATIRVWTAGRLRAEWPIALQVAAGVVIASVVIFAISFLILQAQVVLGA
jgi:uncharacterized paraquat-inducible protein A